jgi:hypothetical protein
MNQKQTVLAAMAWLACSSAWATPPANELVGSWQLLSYVDAPEGAEPIRAFGNKPIGLFIFTADGHVSINIMRNPPDVASPTADPDPDACLPGWYCSYFGTYTVDTVKGAWTTHVLGGNIPAYIGTDQSRTFTISDDRLVIAESYMQGDRRVHAERILVRAPDMAAPPEPSR